jgi:TonB family protein
MRISVSLLSRSLQILLLTILFAETAHVGFAQGTRPGANSESQPVTTGSAALSEAQIDKIIHAFTAKETQFRRALNEYAFKRDALIQEIGMGGQVIGEYHRVSDFTFDDQGNRFEKIGFFPMATLQGVSITNEDLEDLGGVNPFALEGARISQYNFKYVGKERIDELDLYVFDVAPKAMPDPKKSKDRFFVGRIWVDDRDLQIVKAKGKAGPETKTNKFPTVETYREQIDGKYWFPTYVYADDDLVFDNGNDVRIRMRVKYSDYKVGRGKVTITEVGEATSDQTQTQPKPQAQSNTTTPPSTAQPVSTGEETPPLEGGILNSKAVSMPAPRYPAEAKRAGAYGQVQVKVLIDETGKVISAEAVFGSESLRAAAVEAAKQARFTPAKSNGMPAKVSGILFYEFKQ